VQAAIAAVHSAAATVADTDWNRILQRYDQLLALQPTPVVAMNRAIVVAEVHGAAAGLDALEDLDLGGYHLFHAARADLLERLGRTSEAVEAWTTAAGLATNDTERRYLTTRRAAALEVEDQSNV
jgi:RNA polymerase sigma-70 factor (ECF subfamily)